MSERELDYHVVFQDNIDGIVAAAYFLRNRINEGRYRLYPVSRYRVYLAPSSNKGEKFRLMMKRMSFKKGKDFIVIIDYENHDKSDLWIDYHWSPIMGEDPINNDKTIYDPGIKSVTRLLVSGDNVSPQLIDKIETINQMSFNSPNELFEDESPTMIIRAHIERSFPAEMMISRVVEMIARTNLDMEKAAYQMKLEKRVITSLREEALSVKKELLVSGNFSVLRQRRVNQFPQHAEFYVRPETMYAVRMSNIGGGRTYFQVGYNKWHNQQNNVNIGLMLSNISYLIRGGGHHNIGGAVVEGNKIEQLLDDISVYLNQEEKPVEEEMEKVGVDAEDPVESKAKEMVKDGSEKDLNSARDKLSTNKSDGDKGGSDGRKTNS